MKIVQVFDYKNFLFPAFFFHFDWKVNVGTLLICLILKDYFSNYERLSTEKNISQFYLKSSGSIKGGTTTFKQ